MAPGLSGYLGPVKPIMLKLQRIGPLLMAALGFTWVTGIQAQLVVNAGNDVTICKGGQVTLGGAAPTGGTAPYMYSWSPATGLSSTTAAHPVCTTTTTQTYFLTVTDIDGETGTDQVTVTVIPSPTIDLVCTNATTSTYGGVLTFSLCDQGVNSFSFDFVDNSNALGGATYSIDWNNGQTETFSAPGWTSTQDFPIGLTSGTYTITNPPPNSCVTSIPFHVFVGEVPLGGLSVVSNSSICVGSSISFEWNNFGTNPPGTLYIVDYGDGQVDTLMQPPATTFSHTYTTSSCAVSGGEYSIAWRITNPCDTRTGVIGQIRVSGAPEPVVNVGADTVCVNTTVYFSDNSLGMQAPACTNPKRVWSLSPSTGWTTGGNMGSVNSQPANPGVWSNGAASLAVTFSMPGSYTMMTVVGNVCGVDTIYTPICVEEPPVPAFTLSDNVGCTPLTITTDNGSTSTNSCLTRFNWTATATNAACGSGASAAFTGGTGAASAEPQFTLTGAGSYTITLQAINSCGTFPVQETVSVGGPPEVDLDPIAGICAGQSITPTATFNPCGVPIDSYSWSFPGGNPSTSTVQSPGTITFSNSGTFTVAATAGSICGTGSDNAAVTVTPLPAAPVVDGPIVVCVGEDLQLSVAPMPGATFHWTGPNGFSSDQDEPLITNVSFQDQGVYSVNASLGGCTGPASTVTVTVNPAPVISISPATPTTCQGGNVTLTGLGGSDYQWTFEGTPVGSGSPFTFAPAQTGTVVLHGQANGCTGATSTLITVYPLPPVDAGPDHTFCEGAQQQALTAYTPGGSWSGSPDVTSGGGFTPTTQGTYELYYSIISAQGCMNTDTIEVTVIEPPPTVVAGADSTICINDPPIQFNGTPAGGIWNGDISIGGLFVPAAPGTFTITYSMGSGSCFTMDEATVTVLDLPTIDPGADMAVCLDEPAFALGATPPGGTWTGSGVTGDDFDPAVAGDGQHVLHYALTDQAGCTNTDSRTITVHPLPVVVAGNDTTFCDQQVAQVLDGYSPAGGTWTGPGVDPNGLFMPNGPATTVLTYAYTDVNGCSASDQMTVTVITIDDPATTANDTALCIHSGALQLAAGPAGGTWSGPYVDPDGTFTPDVQGSFTLTYSVGAGSCVTMDQMVVVVHPLPQPTFTDLQDACVNGDEQLFGATPAGGIWTGTGITDSSVGTFDPATSGMGSFPITYTYTDAEGCTGSITGDVEVHGLPTAAFSTGPIACASVPFTFTDESMDAVGWDWDFGGDGTSGQQFPQHAFTASGTYTVTLGVTSADGCLDTIAHDITVWDGPTVAFDLDFTEGCGPLVVLPDNQSAGDGVSYDWDFGDGSTADVLQPGMHTFPAGVIGDTTYVITLTATNTCGVVNATAAITVHPEPTVLFGPEFDSGCSPWPVTLSNISVGLPDAYWWDFGDGLTSTTTDSLVQHTYYTDDTDSVYTITLAATNACGTDTARYDITVLPNDVTAFFNTDITSGCAPLTVNFTQYSIGVNNWYWDLDDGNVTTDHDVSHTYNDPGTYTVTLYGDNGCSFDTVEVVITVHETPPADFTVAPGPHCAGAVVQFTNNTPAPAGLTWDFGDGSTSTLSAPQHAYAAAGIYTVTLSVAANNTPCPAMASQNVQVSVTPVASITAEPISGCVPLEVDFQNGSTNTDFNQWDFGDGNTGTAINPVHTFTVAGTYLVQLVAENLNSCSDTALVTIVAFPLPTSSFTMDHEEHCGAPATVQLTSTATGAAGHTWDFGNGNGSVLNNPVAQFDGPGAYDITLVVSNQYGCTDSAMDTFTVHPAPVAVFSTEPSPACAGYPVRFLNHSLDAFSFEWDFGDGEGSGEEAPVHAYEPGDHSVTLIATGAGGCTDTVQVPGAVHVDPRPVAAFTYETMSSTSYAVQFHNQSMGAVAWLWDFGDGRSSEEFSPFHLYPAGPNSWYPFCLIAINEYECPDTLCQSLLAPSDPGLFAANAFTPDQDGLNEDFLPVLNGFDNWRYEFLVFDRWGEVIFHTRDRQKPWDGSVRGRLAKSDVYVWKVVLNREGDERVYYGHVTLIRGTE